MWKTNMDSFWGNIFRSGADQEDSLFTILQRIPIFRDLKNRELRAVERILHQRNYQPGEVVFQQGNPGVGMYIIHSGQVEVVFEPTGQILAELSDGEFFGELGLIDESPRSATVVVKSECKLFGFFQSDLRDLIDRNPQLGVKIVMQLVSTIGERLKRSNEQVQDLRTELHNLSQKQRSSENS